MSSFTALHLVEPLCRALDRQGYRAPTPIQAGAIPALLRGQDVLGIAQTGTGKTAAYALPILQHIAHTRAVRARPVRALVLAPTRELARQIGIRFGRYGRFLDIRQFVLFGGVPIGPQISALEQGVDVLVATPGRLLDLVRRRRVSLDRVAHIVLDEADRMLDMGFIGDIRQILDALPSKRQAMLFSATLPPPVERLAAQLVHDPVRVEVMPSGTPVARIVQQVMYLERLNKCALLTHLLQTLDVERALVFTRTRRGADRLNRLLQKAGIGADAIHGDLSQAARTGALDGFRRGENGVLVATDVASRGLDIAQVSHVFNFDLPSEPESYVHRIGRTGRAGRSGVAIAFCDELSGGHLRDIERLTGVNLIPIFDHPWHSHDAVPAPGATGRAPGGRVGDRRRRTKKRR